MIAPRWPNLETLAARTGFATEQNAGHNNPSGRHGGRRLISSVIPDRYASWIPSAAKAARKAAGERSIMFSTGPMSSGFAARFAHGRRPWIADVNDLFAMNPWRRVKNPMLDRMDASVERATIGHATRLTTVNDVMTDELRRRFDFPVTTIISGFDLRDFDGRRHDSTDGPVRLLFAGTIYPMLDLRPLWTAMRQGQQEGWLTPERLHVTFVGRLSERAALEAADFGIAELVRTRRPVPRDELLDELVAADVLLLPLYERDPTALPMRFFEYVGSGRPIVAFGLARQDRGALRAGARPRRRCARQRRARGRSSPADRAAGRATGAGSSRSQAIHLGAERRAAVGARARDSPRGRRPQSPERLT